MTILGALALQQGSQTLQSLLGIHNAGGVVGGVDNDRLSMLGNTLLNSVQMNLESLGISGHHHQLAAVGRYEGAILGEEGGDRHNLGIGIHEQGLDDGDQSGSGAAGEEQLAGLYLQTEARSQILGNGGTGLLKAGCHGIAMQLDGIRLVHDFLDGLVDLLGGGNAGIAQRIVINLLRADNLSLFQTIGEQLTDDGGGGTQIVVFLIDHDNSSSFFLILRIRLKRMRDQLLLYGGFLRLSRNYQRNL